MHVRTYVRTYEHTHTHKTDVGGLCLAGGDDDEGGVHGDRAWRHEEAQPLHHGRLTGPVQLHARGALHQLQPDLSL